MARIKRRTNVLRLRGLAMCALLLASLVAMLGYAATGQVWEFAVAGVAGYFADLYLHRKDGHLMRRLGQLRVGISVRAVLRAALLIYLVSNVPGASARLSAIVIVLLIAFLACQAGFATLTSLIRRHRSLPFSTRNIDLGRLRIYDSPRRFMMGWPGQRILHHELIYLIGLAGMGWTSDAGALAAGLAVTATLSVLTLLYLLPHLSRAMRFPSQARALHAINLWLATYQPEAVLYFSGSRGSEYQVNMWLETMERLDVRVLVLLRERHLLVGLGQTALPVLCVPGAVHLMNMDFTSVRVAMYPANVGKNIHLLRVPTMRHTFIGHGDSDKMASVNPYSKVYDEVWVAGTAGRDRYRTAGVGIDDRDVVEVGRPQLDELTVSDQFDTPATVPTVLYAPTWEGWTDDPANTSLVRSGEHIVSGLLSSSRPVRVIYKPHPFTGMRDPQALRAHERIVRLISKANGRPSGASDSPQADTAGSTSVLKRIEDELEEAAATFHPLHTDEAQRSRDSSKADIEALDRIKRLDREWEDTYWSAQGPTEHLIILGKLPSLYSCFRQADLLISDISSVISDFVATAKPYAITNTSELNPQEFRDANTVARAAYILDPDATDILRLVDLLFQPDLDVLRDARRGLKSYLLGPDSPSATSRFNSALHELARSRAAPTAT